MLDIGYIIVAQEFSHGLRGWENSVLESHQLIWNQVLLQNCEYCATQLLRALNLTKLWEGLLHIIQLDNRLGFPFPRKWHPASQARLFSRIWFSEKIWDRERHKWLMFSFLHLFPEVRKLFHFYGISSSSIFLTMPGMDKYVSCSCLSNKRVIVRRFNWGMHSGNQLSSQRQPIPCMLPVGTVPNGLSR